MSSQYIPKAVKYLQLAQEGCPLQGVVPLAALERLAGFITSREGNVSYTLRFKKQRRDGRIKVSGEVRTDLMMTCQYCLEPVSMVVEATIALVLVRSEDEAGLLESGVDALVVAGEEIDPVAIIEDDLILALPMVPRHMNDEGESECIGQLGYEKTSIDPGEDKPNPFAVLAGLKDRDN
jgi:uncharacterized protein